MIRYQDNFLPKDEFNFLKLILNPTLTYTYDNILEDDKIECDPLQNFQFVHTIVRSGKSVSPHYPLFKTLLLDKLNAEMCDRMKINVTTNTDKPVEHGYHKDWWDVSDSDLKMNTAIFYFNTCDGYTAIKTPKGKLKKVKSVANRICIFPPHWLHTGTTTSDSKIRTVLNIVYQEKPL